MSNKGKQFSTRFWEPYDELVTEKARMARLKPNQLVRFATMAAVDSDLLSIHERMKQMDHELKVLRQDQATLIGYMKRILGIEDNARS